MKPKISVIVPVYNTEKYLDRCIQCIQAQAYTDSGFIGKMLMIKV